MRMLTAALLVLFAACSGDAPTGDRTCDGTLYDACSDEHDCMSSNCHNFMTQQFQVCSTGCTVGDDSPCMATSDGKKATCVAIASGPGGICTPPAANPCKH
jgi:hypothetical protein